MSPDHIKELLLCYIADYLFFSVWQLFCSIICSSDYQQFFVTFFLFVRFSVTFFSSLSITSLLNLSINAYQYIVFVKISFICQCINKIKKSLVLICKVFNIGKKGKQVFLFIYLDLPNITWLIKIL